jgi:hypothetical protein
MEPCRPWNKVEPIIITVPEETRAIVKDYLDKRRLKSKRIDKVLKKEELIENINSEEAL